MAGDDGENPPIGRFRYLVGQSRPLRRSPRVVVLGHGRRQRRQLQVQCVLQRCQYCLRGYHRPGRFHGRPRISVVFTPPTLYRIAQR